MYFYKKIKKFLVQIALYGTYPKFKKCLKNWLCPLGVNKRHLNLRYIYSQGGHYGLILEV